MSRSFLDASIPELVKQLTTDEKISLLGAPNWWNTTAVARLQIPAVRMSDGPNGVRGSSHFIATPAQCLPCATSMASTFDTDIIFRVGGFLAEEAKIKSSVILLAPTCNIQRSPLGGRAFESFSEDPHLSGTLAAAYVNGLQSNGVAATIKHFVANDQENERTAADSVVSDRALREIYLYPFMLAQKLAAPWAIMTSYGRIGGVHCSENAPLLQGILRDEWKFNGVVISDWFGTYGVDEAINAGLDLEMPGPPRWRTPLLINHCLGSQKLLMPTIDERVTTILTFVQQLAKINPDIVYGDGMERSRDSPKARSFCRELAANSIVVLKNQENILPLKVKNLLVVGPNAKGRVISGGGSAALKATYVVSPWDGIVQAAGQDISVNFAVGCYAHKFLPTLESSMRAPTGESGWLCSFFNQDEDGNDTEHLADFVMQDTRLKLNDFLPEGLSASWLIRAQGILTVQKSCTFEFGLTVAGRAKLYVNDRLVIDNWTKQRPGEFFYGQGSAEEKASMEAVAGEEMKILVEYSNLSPVQTSDDEDDEDGSKDQAGSAQPALMRGVRLGGCEKIDVEEAMEEAAKLASKADAVIYVGGLNSEWESEGFDRVGLNMPGKQDELIQKLGEANRNTVVVIQAGSAVSMPWVDNVNAVVQAWYLGNEAGNAIADILFGKVNPSARLPLTFPARIEDIAAYPNLRCENGKIYYREDLFVGYKHYQARAIKPLFPFGFGLSYTEFSLDDLTISEPASNVESDGFRVEVSVKVVNVGSLQGSETVQLYIAYPEAGLSTPSLQLKAFAKAKDIKPGEAKTVVMSLDKYSVSSWDTRLNQWVALSGEYKVLVGQSSVDLPLEGRFEVKNTFRWSGL